jgi:hypothetical protein
LLYTRVLLSGKGVRRKTSTAMYSLIGRLLQYRRYMRQRYKYSKLAVFVTILVFMTVFVILIHDFALTNSGLANFVSRKTSESQLVINIITKHSGRRPLVKALKIMFFLLLESKVKSNYSIIQLLYIFSDVIGISKVQFM